MTGRDNVLVSDMRETGILFRLWESLRLNENSRNLEIMLRYLDTLCHRDDRHFEEYFQYADRLAGRTSSAARMPERWAELSGRRSTADPHFATPVLVDAIAGINVVKYRGKYFGIAHALGPIDLQSVEPESLPGVIVADSLAAIREHIGA